MRFLNRCRWPQMVGFLLAFFLVIFAMAGLFLVDGLLTLALGRLMDAARALFGG